MVQLIPVISNFPLSRTPLSQTPLSRTPLSRPPLFRTSLSQTPLSRISRCFELRYINLRFLEFPSFTNSVISNFDISNFLLSHTQIIFLCICFFGQTLISAIWKSCRLRLFFLFLKGAISRFAHLAKFSLNFSSSSFLFHVNLLHPCYLFSSY